MSVAGEATARPPAAGSRPKWGREIALWAALALGLLLTAALIRASGAHRIGVLLLDARWWLLAVVLLHLPQTFCSALGWGRLLDRARRPSVRRLFVLRWVREAVNSLLPVAQIGGDVARARLLARDGTSMGVAAASCALDLSLELVAQVVFTLLGLALLAAFAPRSPALALVGAAALGLAALAGGLFFAQRMMRTDAAGGLAGRLRARLSARSRSRPMAPAAETPFRPSRAQQAEGFAWHLASWLLGALETWAGLRAVGVHAGLREPLVIESLSQALRSAAFAVPGALGVQEGGMILICGLFGVSPARAVALALVRRVREVALGAPGLVVWRVAARRPAVAAIRGTFP